MKRDRRGPVGPLAEILRKRQREALERVGAVAEQPRVDHDALWRELVDARRDAALARADLEAIRREAEE